MLDFGPDEICRVIVTQNGHRLLSARSPLDRDGLDIGVEIPDPEFHVGGSPVRGDHPTGELPPGNHLHVGWT